MKYKLLTFLCAVVLSTNAQIDSVAITGNGLIVSGIFVDNNDKIWLPCQNKLKYYDGSTWQTFTGTQYTTRRITQTTDGKIWIAGGILQYYDGTFWHYPDSSNLSPLLSTGITDLEADSSGNLWVSTNGGYCKYDGTNWTDFTTANTAYAGNNVYSIRFDNDNNRIVIGTDVGVSVIDNGNVANYPLNNTVFELAISNGEIWARKPGGLYFLHGGNMISVEDFQCLNTPYLAYPNIYCKTIFPDYNGGVIFWNGQGTSDLNYTTNTTSHIWAQPYSTTDKFFIKGGVIYDYQINGTIKRVALYSLNANSYTIANDLHCRDGVGGYCTGGLTELYSFAPNQVKAMVSNGADMFWDFNSNPRYEVPKGSGTFATFAGSLWLGGMVNNQVRTACQTYRQNGLDFWPGPLDTTSGVNVNDTLLEGCTARGSRYAIEEFKYHFNNGDVQSGAFVPDPGFFAWPATNTGNFSRYNAPYIDYNNDGHYNPMDGDYPEIKGDYMIFHDFNDASGAHGETGGNGLPLHVEVKARFYGYSCNGIADSMKALNYTTFYEYEIINRSDTTIDSMYVGFWNDVDLGNYIDDYVGCSVTDNTGYVYNGDSYDEASNGLGGYGNYPPSFATAIIESPHAYYNDGIDNNHNGVLDETDEDLGMSVFLPYNNNFDPLSGNPQNQMGYYNYLRGKWMDGSPVTYGDFGMTSGSLPTTFMFPGNSDPVGYGVGGSPANPNPQPVWSETTVGNSPGDRRFLISSGPFVLPAKASTKIVYALVFTQDSTAPGDNIGVIAKNLQDVRRIKNWYNTNSFPSCIDLSTIGMKEQSINAMDATIYPNPGTGLVSIKVEGEEKMQTVEVMDLLGSTLLKANIMINGTLDLSGYSEGVYLIKITSGLKQKTFKYIKQ